MSVAVYRAGSAVLAGRLFALLAVSAFLLGQVAVPAHAQEHDLRAPEHGCSLCVSVAALAPAEIDGPGTPQLGPASLPVAPDGGLVPPQHLRVPRTRAPPPASPNSV